MKISWNWLNDYITWEKFTVEEASSVLTSIGLEVEAVEKFESIKGGLDKFFIGEVIRCEKHPNADKLSLTKVDLGSELGIRSIVCGAPNVAKGQKVVVATEGAIVYLPGGESFTIKNSKIRGEESQGMICAEDELGIGSSHAGILVLEADAKLGQPAADYFGITTDIVFEIGLTPNRTDAMFHKGVARDLAAAINARGGKCEFHSDGKLVLNSTKTTLDRNLNFIVKSSRVPKYGGCLIEGVSNNSSPNWMKERLVAIGETPKNLLVDVTNYILHDLGQPLHAYDVSKLSGDEIVVEELASEGEMVALNGQPLKLKVGDIIIQDNQKIIGLAGIMGSASSSIDNDSQSIFLEGAYFNSTSIRQTSQRLQLRSEAAVKFEKGIDPNGMEYALGKARDIILSISSGAVSGDIGVYVSSKFPDWEVLLTRAKLDVYANASIEKSEVDFILTALGIKIESSDDNTWNLCVPRYKEDVKREEDVIEEILRIYGYNRLPYPKFLRSNLSFTEKLSASQLEENLSNFLSGNGCQEIMTNSISQSRYYGHTSPIRLLNSMTSELDCMRPSIIPGFLEVIAYNLNRDQKDLMLYEFGSEYFLGKAGIYIQTKKLVIACTGMKETPNWQVPKGQPNDYFQLKSIVERMFVDLKLDILYKESVNPDYVYGLSIWIGQKEVGYLGELTWDKKLFSIKQKIYMARLDFDAILQFKVKEKIQYKEVPKFPVVRRDLALVLNSKIRFDQLESIAQKSIGNSLSHISLFDIFHDKSLGEGKKSYAVRFFLSNPDKTLSDKEIDGLMNRLINGYQKELSAEIRS